MSWLRLRAPYLVLVVFAFLAFSIHSGDIDKLTTTQHELVDTQAQVKAAVTRLNTVFRTGTRGSCLSRNKLRDGIVGFVIDTEERSRRANTATLASPTATPEQKQASTVNLAQLTATLAQLRTRLPIMVCPKGTP